MQKVPFSVWDVIKHCYVMLWEQDGRDHNSQCEVWEEQCSVGELG